MQFEDNNNDEISKDEISKDEISVDIKFLDDFMIMRTFHDVQLAYYPQTFQLRLRNLG